MQILNTCDCSEYYIACANCNSDKASLLLAFRRLRLLRFVLVLVPVLVSLVILVLVLLVLLVLVLLDSLPVAHLQLMI